MSTDDLQRVNERLRAIESNLTRVLQQLSMEWVEPGPVTGVPEEVVELAKAGDRIGAVKRYRDLTDAGLAEANDVVSRIVP